jgi:hypothetical protein
MAVTVDLSGSVVVQPAVGSSTFPTSNDTLTLGVKRTYTREFGGIIAVTGTDGTPQPLPFGSITKVKFVALRVTGGKVKFRITTADGAAQILPVTGTLVIDNPDSGSEITALTMAVVSAGPQVEYTLAGEDA